MYRPHEWFLGASMVAVLSLVLAVPSNDAPRFDVVFASEAMRQKGPAATEPVIWVHGCPPPFGNSEAASHLVADNQQAFFRERGYPDHYLYRFVFSGPNCGSTIDHAKQLAELVSEVRLATGAAQVSIVAHSMGALASRLYITDGGHQYVRKLITTAGANHGGEAAAQGIEWQAQFGYPAYEGAKEMYPPYACEGETSGGAADVQFWLNGCLTATGRTVDVDEMPYGIEYLSIWNTIDEMVVPAEAACLGQRFQNDCSSPVNIQVTVGPAPGPCGPSGCPGHVAMLWEPVVVQLVYDFITN